MAVLLSIFLGLISTTTICVGDPAAVSVNSKNITHQVNPLFMGCHSDSGFYSQMIFGESFENILPNMAGAANSTSLVNVANGGSVRHCDFELYTCDFASEGSNEDFIFVRVPALDGSGGVSFQSTNFQQKYLGLLPAGQEEAGRMGLIAVQSADDKRSASFNEVPGLSDPKQVSLESSLKSGYYMAVTGHLQGGCSGSYHGKTASDVIVASLDSITDRATATWTFQAGPPPPVAPWQDYVAPGVDATLAIDSSVAFHGFASQKITVTSGAGIAGVANRGLGSEGLFIQDGKDYNGFFFASSAKPVTFVVQLVAYATNTTLASQTIVFNGGNWTRLNFTFVASGGTTCVDGSGDPTVSCGKMGPASHICVQCGGELLVGVQGVGDANVDYVFLQPGTWGRFQGLEVLSSGVEILKSMGITTVRLGGSFTDPAYYFWKNWIGPKWERPSLQSEWGHELISGWGPFEFIDMCNAAGIEPVVTTTGVCDACLPEDMGDLIEFCHGGANTTWGQKRIAYGHPDPYDVKYFELGNEQYNPLYPEQVKNMEERATGLGLANTMFYMNPNNARWLTPSDAAKVEALGIRDHAVMDEHVGGGGGVEVAKTMFERFPNYTMGAVNAETNAGIHTVSRMMMEAKDLLDWFNCAEPWCARLHFRTASFCTERSGHYDAFDQGISFFLPNMSWIQPPDTWASNGVDITATGVAATAQLSDDRAVVHIRIAADVAGEVALVLNGKPVSGAATVTTIANDDLNAANPPGNPTAISPTTTTTALQGSVNVAANSFTVVSVAVPT